MEVILSTSTVQWFWVAFWLTLMLGGMIVFLAIVLNYAYGGQSYPSGGSHIPPPKVPPPHPNITVRSSPKRYTKIPPKRRL